MSGLTPRQREVYLLVADGLTDKQIGARLVPPISDETVAVHIHHIVLKLGLERGRNIRVQIANHARRTAA